MSFSPSRTTANSQPSAKIITDALGVNIMAPLMYNNGGRLEEKSLRELVNPVMSSYGGAELLTSVLCDRIGDGEKDRKRRMKADSAMKKRYDADMARYEKANELPNVKRVSEWRLLRMGNNPGPKAMLRPKLGLEGVENMEGLGWDIWHSRVVQVELVSNVNRSRSLSLSDRMIPSLKCLSNTPIWSEIVRYFQDRRKVVTKPPLIAGVDYGLTTFWKSLVLQDWSLQRRW